MNASRTLDQAAGGQRADFFARFGDGGGQLGSFEGAAFEGLTDTGLDDFRQAGSGQAGGEQVLTLGNKDGIAFGQLRFERVQALLLAEQLGGSFTVGFDCSQLGFDGRQPVFGLYFYIFGHWFFSFSRTG